MTRWWCSVACAGLVACGSGEPPPVIVVGGTAASPSGAGRPFAALDPSVAWQCPFPAQADAVGIEDGVVTLQAAVRADGTADSVTVVSDPGSGFGTAAQRCALAAKFLPALDERGAPIAGSTRPFQVPFHRPRP